MKNVPKLNVSTVPLNSTDILGDSNYIRERVEPHVSDLFYLCLTDFRNFIAHCAPRLTGLVFDYGCGGSPYKNLFSKCARYTRADMQGGPGIDVTLDAEGKTGEPSGTYQGLVSFQVIEHVPKPHEYLEECHRLLSEDGLLLVTTHGLYLEHKCPSDYYRWTSEGLEELVTAHGFTIVESVKITTGIRGAIQLMHHIVDEFVQKRGTFGGLILRAFRKVYRVTLMPLLNLLGKLFLASEGVIPGNAVANMYVGVGVLARKN